MTLLERLALRVSARITGADLVLVLDYAEALGWRLRVVPTSLLDFVRRSA
jgi:hypothetical protein